MIHELTFFNRLPDDHYQRLHETHFERAYELKEWRRRFKAGFNQIEVKADFGSQAIDEKTTRWFFICQAGGLMHAVGLVTEYNPFHNGHRYHLSQARELTHAEVVVAVMSGNFTQRGVNAA